MEIHVSIHQAEQPIAIMGIAGEVNASNYLDIVTRAQELYQTGVHDLVMDLSQVTAITSAGLVALHQLSLIYSGVEHSIEKDGTEMRTDVTHSGKARKHVKLLNPQPPVDQALQASGLTLFFKIFGDIESAIGSFKK